MSVNDNDKMVAAFNNACKIYDLNGHIEKIKDDKYIFAEGNIYYAAGDIKQMLACIKNYVYKSNNPAFKGEVYHNIKL